MRPHRRQPTWICHPWDSPSKNPGVGCHCLLRCMKGISESEVAQSCPTLSNPMDCSPPGSSVHAIFQARVLEWVAIAFSVIFAGLASQRAKLVEVIEFQLSYSKSWKMMLWKCCTQYASKFGRLSSGHRTRKGQFSFQSQKKAMPKNAQTTAQLHSSHTLVK